MARHLLSTETHMPGKSIKQVSRRPRPAGQQLQLQGCKRSGAPAKHDSGCIY